MTVDRAVGAGTHRLDIALRAPQPGDVATTRALRLATGTAMDQEPPCLRGARSRRGAHAPRAARAAFAPFASFCLASWGVYLLNDVIDADADRRHPKKRQRPTTRRQLTPVVAVTAGAFLACTAIAGAWLIGSWQLTLVVAAFVATTVAYTLRLKREPTIELVAVAAGFVLRAVAGGVATHVQLSSWFLVVTCFGALFLGHRQAGGRAGGAGQKSGHSPFCSG